MSQISKQIDEAMQPGESVAACARRLGVDPQPYYTYKCWQRKKRKFKRVATQEGSTPAPKNKNANNRDAVMENIVEMLKLFTDNELSIVVTEITKKIVLEVKARN